MPISIYLWVSAKVNPRSALERGGLTNKSTLGPVGLCFGQCAREADLT